MTYFDPYRRIRKNLAIAQGCRTPSGTVTDKAKNIKKYYEGVKAHNETILAEKDAKTKERFDKYAKEFAWKD